MPRSFYFLLAHTRDRAKFRTVTRAQKYRFALGTFFFFYRKPLLVPGRDFACQGTYSSNDRSVGVAFRRGAFSSILFGRIFHRRCFSRGVGLRSRSVAYSRSGAPTTTVGGWATIIVDRATSTDSNRPQVGVQRYRGYVRAVGARGGPLPIS
ncbi:hypothetical protein PUN28_006821 [Cardiocondyla obscurior]|uniref:Uncharacterized protein n=1 Tax=Cardiocondyla obscurior TaxID=286306 RepID=A0AAW2G0G0_9HYME